MKKSPTTKKIAYKKIPNHRTGRLENKLRDNRIRLTESIKSKLPSTVWFKFLQHLKAAIQFYLPRIIWLLPEALFATLQLNGS